MTDAVLTRPTITAAAAQAAIAAAAEQARGQGLAMTIAVTDGGGALVAFLRMDGAPLLTVGIAQDKAYTAAAYGLATHDWHDFIKDDAPLALGIVHTPRLVTFGGGYPLICDGAVAGAIGVSGGHYTQDMVVAQAGVAAFTALLG